MDIPPVKLKFWALIVLIIIATSAAVAVLKLTRGPAPAPSKAANRPQERVPVEEHAEWGETHPSFVMHAPVGESGAGDQPPSRVVADLPQPTIESGGTIHIRVAKPRNAVLDERGKAFAIADEVVLIAAIPEIGIGLELDRLVINPKENAVERGWNTFEVHTPPCARQLRLEARPGIGPESKNAYDVLLVNVSEPLVFRRGPPPRACEEFAAQGSCPAISTCPTARSRQHTKPAGALRTGLR